MICNTERENKNSDCFYKGIKKLPIVLINIISKYVPNIVYMWLNREYYYKYHNLLSKYMNPKVREQYIRQIVRKDDYFVFNQLLIENYSWWLKMTKYLYKDAIYTNYLMFLNFYCLDNDSFECKELITNLLKELGLSKNQHKKNIIRNIRWKN
jgi:hypothetical protein